jgi:hypothetical protein
MKRLLAILLLTTMPSQHLRQDLKYSKTNLICLCRRCHFTIGHKNNWTNVFTNVMMVIEADKK